MCQGCKFAHAATPIKPGSLCAKLHLTLKKKKIEINIYKKLFNGTRPSHRDLSNDITCRQIQSRDSVLLRTQKGLFVYEFNF